MFLAENNEFLTSIACPNLQHASVRADQGLKLAPHFPPHDISACEEEQMSVICAPDEVD